MTHRMIVHDAKEMAGCFYEMDRSVTWRATWPDQDGYVAAKWPHFVKAVREVYAELLGRPDVPPDQKERMYEALTDDVESVVSDGAASPIQISRDSQVFVGDRGENRRIKDIIGVAPMPLRAKWRSTTALIN